MLNDPSYISQGTLMTRQFNVNFLLFAMHATTTRCKMIAFMPAFRSKYSLLIGLFNWGQLRLMM